MRCQSAPVHHLAGTRRAITNEHLVSLVDDAGTSGGCVERHGYLMILVTCFLETLGVGGAYGVCGASPSALVKLLLCLLLTVGNEMCRLCFLVGHEALFTCGMVSCGAGVGLAVLSP